MSEILKTSRLCMLLLATALILSQFMMLGCCQISDADGTNIDTTINDFNTITDMTGQVSAGKIASITSLDKRFITSFGDGEMGLINNMKTDLSLDTDGSILKSRKVAMFSYGSDLMNIGDISGFSGRDIQGNEFSMESERLVTLKDCSFPFALLSEDLTRLSSDGSGIEDLYLKNVLLLPDTYTAEDLDKFTLALGGADKYDFRTFTLGINGTLSGAGFNDIDKMLSSAGFGTSNLMPFDFGEFLKLFLPKDSGDKSRSENGVTVYWKDHL
jgi:hypothetical protein